MEQDIPELNSPIDYAAAFKDQMPGGTPPAPPSPPTHTAAGPSKHITIRISSDVLDAIQRQAARTGTPYQTLINDMLRSGSVGW
jgi:uncharacterized protein (DUF4415 family)